MVHEKSPDGTHSGGSAKKSPPQIASGSAGKSENKQPRQTMEPGYGLGFGGLASPTLPTEDMAVPPLNFSMVRALATQANADSLSRRIGDSMPALCFIFVGAGTTCCLAFETIMSVKSFRALPRFSKHRTAYVQQGFTLRTTRRSAALTSYNYYSFYKHTAAALSLYSRATTH